MKRKGKRGANEIYDEDFIKLLSFYLHTSQHCAKHPRGRVILLIIVDDANKESKNNLYLIIIKYLVIILGGGRK